MCGTPRVAFSPPVTASFRGLRGSSGIPRRAERARERRVPPGLSAEAAGAARPSGQPRGESPLRSAPAAAPRRPPRPGQPPPPAAGRSELGKNRQGLSAGADQAFRSRDRGTPLGAAAARSSLRVCSQRGVGGAKGQSLGGAGTSQPRRGSPHLPRCRPAAPAPGAPAPALVSHGLFRTEGCNATGGRSRL